MGSESIIPASLDRGDAIRDRSRWSLAFVGTSPPGRCRIATFTMTQPRKRLPAPARKLQILRSAFSVLARSNYRAAKVADIAAEAQISEAAICRYFPSKKFVLLEALRHMSDRVIILWQREVETRTMPPRQSRGWGGRGPDWFSLAVVLDEVSSIGYSFACISGVGACSQGRL